MTGTPIGKEREYWISFDVENSGRSISGVRVKLCRAMERDMNAKFRINLCEDPLYEALCKYVASNPARNAK